MKLFECPPVLHKSNSLAEFFAEFKVCERDLVLSNRVIIGDNPTKGAQVLWQEDYGMSEPTDEMFTSIYKSVSKPFNRVIGIGGGSVMDLAKLLCLCHSEDCSNLYELFNNHLTIEKCASLILIPTTCGTGSEMTDIAVISFISRNEKLGIAHPKLYAEQSVLIPSLLESLPYRSFAFSVIDALIHAFESYLSPNASGITRALSQTAFTRIIKSINQLAETNTIPDKLELMDLLEASSMAGIAFGNAGCGAVHALSYPISARYHLTHGESNYIVFMPVMYEYNKKHNCEKFDMLIQEVATVLRCQKTKTLERLQKILHRTIQCRTLDEIGAKESDLSNLVEKAFTGQQRLLRNAPMQLRADDIFQIYFNALKIRSDENA